MVGIIIADFQQPVSDTFYTVRQMPDNNNVVPENYPDLHSAVATLSTGPVAFGDKPGFEDLDVLMKCCRSDGKILKPSKAISAIDSQIRSMGLDIEHGPGAPKGTNGTNLGKRWNFQGQLWTTTSEISGYQFGIIFNAILAENYLLEQKETSFVDVPTFVFKYYPEFKIVGENAFPLELSSDEKFGLHYSSPIIRVGDYNTVILGESDKWTRISPQRFSKIMNYGTFLLLELGIN